MGIERPNRAITQALPSRSLKRGLPDGGVKKEKRDCAILMGGKDLIEKERVLGPGEKVKSGTTRETWVWQKHGGKGRNQLMKNNL